MRNVDQAMGVALLGAILIFGISSTMRSEMAKSSSISDPVREQVSGVTINLGSNRTFENEIENIKMTDDERKELVDMEAHARFDAVRIAYVVGAVIVLLGLASTPRHQDRAAGGHPRQASGPSTREGAERASAPTGRRIA